MAIVGLLVLAISYLIFLLLLAGWLTRSAAKRGLRRWPRVLGVIALFFLSTSLIILNSEEIQGALFSTAYSFFIRVRHFRGVIFGLYLGMGLGIGFFIHIKRKTSSILWGIAAFCIAFCISFFSGFVLLHANEIYAYHEYKNICKREGGTHIHKKAEVNGFYYDYGNSEDVYKKFLEAGYEYVEGYLNDHHQIYRFSLDDKRNLIYVPIDRPASQYRFRGNKGTINDYITEYYSYKIDDLKNKETIAATRFFAISMLFTMELVHYFSGSVGCVYAPIFQEFDMILSTLPPIKRKNMP